jgi:hypothetical protein
MLCDVVGQEWAITEASSSRFTIGETSFTCGGTSFFAALSSTSLSEEENQEDPEADETKIAPSSRRNTNLAIFSIQISFFSPTPVPSVQRRDATGSCEAPVNVTIRCRHDGDVCWLTMQFCNVSVFKFRRWDFLGRIYARAPHRPHTLESAGKMAPTVLNELRVRHETHTHLSYIAT